MSGAIPELRDWLTAAFYAALILLFLRVAPVLARAAKPYVTNYLYGRLKTAPDPSPNGLVIIGRAIADAGRVVGGQCGRYTAKVYVWIWSVQEEWRLAFRSLFALTLLVAAVGFLFEIFGLFAFQNMGHLQLPMIVKVTIALLAVWAVRHRLREFHHVREQSLFLATLRDLLSESSRTRFVPEVPDDTKRCEHDFDTFVEKVLGGFYQIYAKRLDAKFNVMFPAGPTSQLNLFYIYPAGTGYDKDAVFSPGEGAAGTAFQDNKLIYVPAVRFRHGIAVDFTGAEPASFTLAPTVYKRTEYAPFRCLLAAPISTDAGVAGILNIDCGKRNAFKEPDLHIASVAAGLLGMAVERFRAGTGKAETSWARTQQR